MNKMSINCKFYRLLTREQMSVKSCLQVFHKVFLWMYINYGYEKSVNFTCGIKCEMTEFYQERIVFID